MKRFIVALFTIVILDPYSAIGNYEEINIYYFDDEYHHYNIEVVEGYGEDYHDYTADVEEEINMLFKNYSGYFDSFY